MAWIYFVVGIICLLALQALRAGLSIVFPLRSVRPGSRPEARQFGGLELVDETTPELTQLGFDGPAWLYCDQQQSDTPVVDIHAVYRNVAKNTVAWVAPVLELSRPHQLFLYYTTALDDGRFAVTQVSDPYYSAVGDPKTPAQTIGASDRSTELQQHLEFVATLGANPVPNVPIRDAVMHFAGEHMNEIRRRLLERGLLREANGIARPTFRFAASLLRKVATRPVSTDTQGRSIPTSQLAYLASVARRNSERAPAQSTQWFLLLLSAILFVAIGWPLLGRDFTIIILAVILFHEAGHWAAMKAFGYRNPHITLLPLLGGVTIGHETEPGAVKRVWVSLAGPLPGIVLGWVLIFFLLTGQQSEIMLQWLLPTISVLLFVNYLNILPIPPLDGAHIVKAILPPNWIAVQVLVVLIGVATGVYVAYLLDFWPLALIAAVQLFAIKGMWADAALIKHFGVEQPPLTTDEDGRTEWLLQKLEAKFGAPKKANKRIQLAQNILSQLDMQPMGALHRTCVSVLYLGLVAVPVGALAFASLDPWMPEMNAESAAMYEDLELRHLDLADKARTMTVGEIVRDLVDAGDLPVSATEVQIAAAENRLGQPLPIHLRNFYRATNGLDTLGLFPVDAIRHIDPALFVSGDLQFHVVDGEVNFYDADFEAYSVPVAATSTWWQIGYSEDWLLYRFVNPDARSGEISVYAASADESAAFVNVQDVLRNEWLNERSAAMYAENTAELVARAAERMQDDNIEDLLDKFPQPGFIERLIFGSDTLPAAADEALIAATEQRIGYPLADDHRRILSLHNGFGPLFLLSAEDIASATRVVEHSFENLGALEMGNEGIEMTLAEFEQCWVVAGIKQEFDDHTEQLFGQIYWCPDLEARRRYFSQLNGGFHPSLTSVVRQAAASMTAW